MGKWKMKIFFIRIGKTKLVVFITISNDDDEKEKSLNLNNSWMTFIPMMLLAAVENGTKIHEEFIIQRRRSQATWDLAFHFCYNFAIFPIFITIITEVFHFDYNKIIFGQFLNLWKHLEDYNLKDQDLKEKS